MVLRVLVPEAVLALMTQGTGETRAVTRVTMTLETRMTRMKVVNPMRRIKPLQDWCFFWDWSLPVNQVRWMTAWDTTADDVAAFAAGVREQLVNAKH